MKNTSIQLRSDAGLSGIRRFLIWGVMGILCTQLILLNVAWADTATHSGTNDLATGAASFLLTPVYGAFKLAFAGAGAIIGGLTWVFTGGDNASAQHVWDASLKGTYIITPEHLEGEKPIHFVGETT